MDIVFLSRGAKLISRVFSSNRRTVPAIPFVPQKPHPISDSEDYRFFERVTPEKVGISSKTVRDFLRDLSLDKTVNLHGITMLKDGKVFCECDIGMYSGEIYHATFSMCKTIVGLAVGMLFDEGKISLDDSITDLLGTSGIGRISKKNLTVRHLLTMSSGVSFNELGAVTETDWEKAYMESSLKFSGGDEFEYNSMNTYILSLIVARVSGISLNNFLLPRLWKPLEIDIHPWETCPKGVEKGGWGLYLRREDAAKIGVLIMNGGVWRGKRLISEKYITHATRRQKGCPKDYGGFDYGYQMWSGREYESFLLNGMFGQNVLGIKKNGIIIVCNGGNDELFQQSGFFDKVQKYFSALDTDRPLKPNIKNWVLLRSELKKISKTGVTAVKNPFLRLKNKFFLNTVSGSEYLLTSKNAVSASLLPVMLRIVQNNYAEGIEKISFLFEEDTLHTDFYTPFGKYRVSAGISAPVYGTLDFCGEEYTVGAFARAGKNEDGIWVITLKLAFCETPSEKTIKFFFLSDGDMRITFTERPGPRLARRFTDLLNAAVKNRFITGIAGKGDKEYIKHKMNSTFEPEYTAVKKEKSPRT